MNLRYVLEAVTNTPIDELLTNEFTRPLGMTQTFFNRGNTYMHDGIAPTEYQIEGLGLTEPDRPQPVWGTVRWATIKNHSSRVNVFPSRCMMKTHGVSMAYQGMPEFFLRRTISLYSVRCVFPPS